MSAMSAVFLCDQVLACTESATSEYSAMSQCLSALLGRRGLRKVKVVLDGQNELVHISLAYDNCPVTQHP